MSRQCQPLGLRYSTATSLAAYHDRTSDESVHAAPVLRISACNRHDGSKSNLAVPSDTCSSSGGGADIQYTQTSFCDQSPKLDSDGQWRRPFPGADGLQYTPPQLYITEWAGRPASATPFCRVLYCWGAMLIVEHKLASHAHRGAAAVSGSRHGTCEPARRRGRLVLARPATRGGGARVCVP